MMQLRRPPSRNFKIPPYAPKIGVVVLALFVLAFLSPAVPKPVTDVAHKAATPVWATRNAMVSAVYGAVAILETKEDLIKQNNALYDEISTLRREAFEADVLREENGRLRELLNRPESGEAVAASVLSRPSSSPYDTVIIDAGEQAGIQKGNIVSVEGGVAVGTVSDVYSDTSLVVLFSAPGKATPVLISAATATPAVAEGWGGGNFTVRLPRDAAVEVDDPVILPTLSPHVFAVVESVESDESDSFQVVRFRVPVNVSTLRHVLVLTGEKFEPNEIHEEEAQAAEE